MKSRIFAAALAFCAMAFSGAADAQVNRTQHNERVRIERGVHNGSLTRREARRLRMEQRRIRATERRMRARHHGRLTWREKRMLHHRQVVASRHIYRKRHNRRHSW